MRNALVTGASGEIGAEIAKSLARTGCNVAVHCNSNVESAQKLCDEIQSYGVKALLVQCDLSSKAQVDIMFERIREVFGGVDILVNNAAYSSIKMLCDVDEAEWDKTFDVNMKGAYLCVNALSPYMIHNKFGRIVNISSIWGVRGASCEVHYSASKAALIGFTKALAKEFALSGITVNCVSPGFIDTKMNAHLSQNDKAEIFEEIPVGYGGKPCDVANAVSFLCSEESSYITGQNLCVDGGWSL